MGNDLGPATDEDSDALAAVKEEIVETINRWINE